MSHDNLEKGRVLREDESIAEELCESQASKDFRRVGRYASVHGELVAFYLWNDRFVLRSESLGRLELSGCEVMWNRSQENIITFEVHRHGKTLGQLIYPISNKILENEEFDYFTQWDPEWYDVLLYVRNVMQSFERQSIIRANSSKRMTDL
jgi:hypothetical protein